MADSSIDEIWNVDNEPEVDPKAEKQAETDAQETEVVVAEAVYTVKLSEDYADSVEADEVTVSVANYDDFKLVRGEEYDVPMIQGQLLVESPAVEAVE